MAEQSDTRFGRWRARRHARPVIAVTGSAVEWSFSWDWWSWQCIRLALFLAGGAPRRITPRKKIVYYDGLLLSGGVDIDPSLYGQENVSSHKCQPDRDALELALLRDAMERGIPVLGICRGAQMVNIGLGGNLHQEASVRFRYYEPRRTVLGKLFNLKKSYISGSRWLNPIFAEEVKHWITSLHHQAIDRLGEGLRCIADDHHGMTQAIELDDARFVLGVQWHPEFELYFPRQFRIFRVFVKACRRAG